MKCADFESRMTNAHGVQVTEFVRVCVAAAEVELHIHRKTRSPDRTYHGAVG